MIRETSVCHVHQYRYMCFVFNFSVFANADGQSIEQSRTSPSLCTHRKKCLDRN